MEENKFTLNEKWYYKVIMIVATLLFTAGCVWMIEDFFVKDPNVGWSITALRVIVLLIALVACCLFIFKGLPERLSFRMDVEDDEIKARLLPWKKIRFNVSEIKKITYHTSPHKNGWNSICFEIKTNTDDFSVDRELKNFNLLADYLIEKHDAGVIEKKAISPSVKKKLARYVTKDEKTVRDSFPNEFFPMSNEELCKYMQGLELRGTVSLVGLPTRDGKTYDCVLWQIQVDFRLLLEVIDTECLLSGFKNGTTEDLISEGLFIDQIEEFPEDLQKYNSGQVLYIEKGKKGKLIAREDLSVYEDYKVVLGDFGG